MQEAEQISNAEIRMLALGVGHVQRDPKRRKNRIIHHWEDPAQIYKLRQQQAIQVIDSILYNAIL